MVMVFEEEVIRAICAYAPLVGRSESRKINFVTTWQVSWICKTLAKWFLVSETSTEILWDGLIIFEDVQSGYEIGKTNVEG